MLAAIVPRPRVHLTRFHGVLAPHCKYRKLIVPAPKIVAPLLEVVTPQTLALDYPMELENFQISYNEF